MDNLTSENFGKPLRMRWVMVGMAFLATVLNYVHRLSFNYLSADGELRHLIPDSAIALWPNGNMLIRAQGWSTDDLSGEGCGISYAGIQAHRSLSVSRSSVNNVRGRQVMVKNSRPCTQTKAKKDPLSTAQISSGRRNVRAAHLPPRNPGIDRACERAVLARNE